MKTKGFEQFLERKSKKYSRMPDETWLNETIDTQNKLTSTYGLLYKQFAKEGGVVWLNEDDCAGVAECLEESSELVALMKARIEELEAAEIKNSIDVVHCSECKYCVKTKDGEYNPDDIVCSYWNSDGLESGDFCSYGEKGEYEWSDSEIHGFYGRWMVKNEENETLECSECGYEVTKDGYFGRFCPCCGVKMLNFKELEEKSDETN